jgi:glycosyltransferase involved in cell wall biosynthesis
MRSAPVDLAVIAPDPAFGGGGNAQTEAFLAAARSLGRSPELLFAPHPFLAGRSLSIDRVEAFRHARWSRRLAPQVRAARSAWVVSTIAVHGAAAPRSGRPYSAWLGTSLADEWRGRAGAIPALRRSAYAISVPVLRRLEREVIAGAERVCATSEASRAGVAAAGGLDADAVAILPIPVDTDVFTPEDDDTWLRRLDAPVVAFVGRADDPRKNARLLLDAAPLLRTRVPDARLRLIGAAPAGPLPDGVEATGPVDSVAEELRTASLFVLPSWQEGFGIVAAEALASGVPVLSTRSGGPEELVRASGGGRLLDTYEPEELADAAAGLLGDGDTLARMRAAGRTYVEREHSPTRFRELLATMI